MQNGRLITVRTDPTAQLRGAIATNAFATLDLSPGNGIGLVDESLAAGRQCTSRLRSLRIYSIQNLAWEIWLWRSNLYNTYASVADLGKQYVAGRYGFQEGDGEQLAGAGVWFYYIDGNDQVYQDLNGLGQIHLMLVNRDATAKLAGDAGAISIELNLEPCLGW